MPISIQSNHSYQKKLNNNLSGLIITQIQSANFYDRLGVKYDDDITIIKQAYRRLCTKVHPDRCSHSLATELMQLLNEAYTCLSDLNKRNLYDSSQVLVDHSMSSNGSDDFEDELRVPFSTYEISDQSVSAYMKEVLLLYDISVLDFFQIELMDRLSIGFFSLSPSLYGQFKMGCVQCPISKNYEFNDFKVCIYKSRYPLITNRAKIMFNDIAVSVLTH